jgi:hypothetical protein
MSDLEKVRGFEDGRAAPLRPVYRSKDKAHVNRTPSRSQAAPRRLEQIVSRAPEAVIIMSGRPRDGPALGVHLHYIAKGGEVELHDQDGAGVGGKEALRELARDWAASARGSDPRHPHAALAFSMVFSAPQGVDPAAAAAASRAAAKELFAGRFDYVSAFHTDTLHPHLHVTVRALGVDGVRINPPLSECMAWRAAYAKVLCDHGIEAVASRCSERGVTPRREPIGLRRLREQHAQGQGQAAEVDRAAYLAAARLAFLEPAETTDSEKRLVRRQDQVRAAYLAEAERLSASQDLADQVLARKVEAFVAAMPEPLSRRQKLARELTAINKALGQRERERTSPAEDRERSR